MQESSSRMERSGGFSVLESRLVAEREREREMKEGGEGVYILPPPKVTVVFSSSTRIIRGNLGSSGVVTE